MKKAGIIGPILLVISCTFNQDKFTRSEFRVINKTTRDIDVYSSAIVHYQSGREEASLHDKLKPGITQSLRVINVSDSFDIDDVFTKLEIFQDGNKSHMPIMDKSKWKNETTADNLLTYTLQVDSTFFK